MTVIKILRSMPRPLPPSQWAALGDMTSKTAFKNPRASSSPVASSLAVRFDCPIYAVGSLPGHAFW